MRIQLRAIVVLWMGALPLYCQGTVSGLLTDEKGKPYADGARVMVIKTADKPDGFVPFVSHAITAKDGSYRIGNVPAGKYDVCIWTSGLDYVNMCRWGKAAGSALVANGGTAQVNVSLTRGKVFYIELNDADAYLDRHENKSAGAFLDIGVYTEQLEMVEAVINQLDRAKRKYAVVVPANAKFRLSVRSALFDVKTQNEAVQSLQVLQDVDQVLRDNDKDKTVTLNVVGVK